MKKWLALATIIAISVTGLVQAKEWHVVRFGIEGAYPPFSMTEADGSLSGFDVDIAKALCKEMHAKCKIVPQDWDGIIPSLLARKYDAIIAAMSITEARKQKVAFTDKYAVMPARFVVKKGTNLQFNKTALKGVKIGVQRASTHDKYLTDNYDGVDIVRYGSFNDAILDLASGRIRAVLGGASIIEDSLLKKPGGDQYQFAGKPMSDPKWFGEGLGIATRKQDKDLVLRLNQAIQAIRANGVYKQIQDKYFSYDVYGQ
jgi:arginine/ornithine transport system substrate-binding protein